MFSTQTIALIVSIVLAFTGYLFTYFNSRSSQLEKARLRRVNDQLRRLYGPLYALTLASESAWRAFMHKYAPGREVFLEPGRTCSAEDLAAWRLWIITVIMPMNDQMERIVSENWDLIEDDEIQPSFIELIAHISMYRTVIERWKSGDFTEHRADIRFPVAFNELVKKHHDTLRARQRNLLRLRLRLRR